MKQKFLINRFKTIQIEKFKLILKNYLIIKIINIFSLKDLIHNKYNKTI